ncbi:MAG: protein kinase [Proteobacteria bacterium]|nr:protein kinase [Pseudomonadota bacterium]
MTDLKTLGKYTIQSILGQGAMGVVYKGFDPHIERTVAIKTIRIDSFDPKELEPLLARFKREAQAAGRLTHPSIVTVYEYGEEDNTAFIAMEFVHGRELKEFLDNNERFPLGTTLSITNQLLDALAYSHNQGVVHRDIKPGNILVLEDGHIKITDFGIARIESSNLTQFGDVMGTPSYMSPEQFMGQQVDKRSDIFSAGVILYHLLTGEKPFPGNSMATIMHRALNTDPPRVSELNFQVPPSFDSIVYKALAKNPNDRFQDAEEFAAALNNAGLAGDGVSSLTGSHPVIPVTRDEKTIQLHGDRPPVAAKPGTETILYRRGRSWALTLLVLIILGAGSFMVWKIYTEKLSADDLQLLITEQYEAVLSLVGRTNSDAPIQEITQSSKKKPLAENDTASYGQEEGKPGKTAPIKVSAPASPAPEVDRQIPGKGEPPPANLASPAPQPINQIAQKPAATPPIEETPQPVTRRAAPGRILKESEW